MGARARISEAGDVTIPKPLRDAYGWTADTELEIVEEANGLVLKAARTPSQEEIDAAIDAFLKLVPVVKGPPLTDEEIDEILVTEAVRRFDATTRD